MKKVLVLGGTRYFGAELVRNLIDKGYEVTIATRGNLEDGFGEKVNRIKVDRNNKEELRKVLSGKCFDVVYDNIAYSPNNVYELLDILRERCGKYVFTSTGSVYENTYDLREEDYNPYSYKITYGTKDDFDYGEGKRLAEAVIFQEFNIPSVAVRFPVVIGKNDYTKRLYTYVNNIKKEIPMDINNLEKEFCFISEENAGGFLSYIGDSDFMGPINSCEKGTLELSEIIEIIESITGKKAIINKNGENAPFNHFKFTENTEKLDSLGYEFFDLKDYLYELIKEYAKEV